jgi:hypothetical protein
MGREDRLNADHRDGGGHTAKVAPAAAECEKGPMTRDDPDEPRRPPTPRTTLRAHCRVTIYCKHCTNSSQLDLPPLIAAGYGDTPLLDLRLKCQRCGSREHDGRVSYAGRRSLAPLLRQPLGDAGQHFGHQHGGSGPCR